MSRWAATWTLLGTNTRSSATRSRRPRASDTARLCSTGRAVFLGRTPGKPRISWLFRPLPMAPSARASCSSVLRAGCRGGESCTCSWRRGVVLLVLERPSAHAHEDRQEAHEEEHRRVHEERAACSREHPHWRTQGEAEDREGRSCALCAPPRSRSREGRGRGAEDHPPGQEEGRRNPGHPRRDRAHRRPGSRHRHRAHQARRRPARGLAESEHVPPQRVVSALEQGFEPAPAAPRTESLGRSRFRGRRRSW